MIGVDAGAAWASLADGRGRVGAVFSRAVHVHLGHELLVLVDASGTSGPLHLRVRTLPAVTSGAAVEPVVITPATPAISTSQQPATATVGTSIADRATVTGGFNPTGTVTFNLFNNPGGTGTPLFTDTEPLSGGMATSAGYIAVATGTNEEAAKSRLRYAVAKLKAAIDE